MEHLPGGRRPRLVSSLGLGQRSCEVTLDEERGGIAWRDPRPPRRGSGEWSGGRAGRSRRAVTHLPRPRGGPGPPEGPSVLGGGGRALAASPAEWGRAASGGDAGGGGLQPALRPPGAAGAGSHGGGRFSAQSALSGQSRLSALSISPTRAPFHLTKGEQQPLGFRVRGWKSEGGSVTRRYGRCGSAGSAGAGQMEPGPKLCRDGHGQTAAVLSHQPVNRLVRLETKLKAVHRELHTLRVRAASCLFHGEGNSSICCESTPDNKGRKSVPAA